MKRKDIEAIYPLTPMQEGMLFHSLFAPESGVYVQQLDGSLRGELDLEAFRRAWQRALDRHSILRTAFLSEGLERPQQVVGRTVTPPIDVQDWRGLDEEDRARRLETFRREDRRRGFKMSKAPLMRLTLLRLDEAAWHFVWTHHHVIMDGWSVAILLNEVFSLYEGFRQGRELELPQARPFGDYVAWMRRLDPGTAEKFWTEYLRGFSEPTALPGIAPDAEAVPEAEPVRLASALSEATTASLRRFAREHGLTLNTLVQGAWALVLGLHARERDVVFGMISAGRSGAVAGIESMVGLFLNALPVRVRLRPEAELVPWLRELQELQSSQRELEHTPLADLQRWSELPRGVPLFESILAFENYPSGAGGGELSLELRDLSAFERTNYPLTVQASDGDELVLRIIYDAGRFEARTVERMLEHFRRALEQMVVRSAPRLSDLGLVTPRERRRLLEEWNGGRTDEPDGGTLHEVIGQRLADGPDRIAVVDGDRVLTYAELHRRAERFARYLASRGVGPEVRVGICLDRSLELVVAVLAVLEAGGGYVPLDPDHPRERSRYIRESSGVGIVLTRRGLLEEAGEDAEGEWIALDGDGERIDRAAGEPLSASAGGDQLAYVIYTSGSTGRPKGTEVTHRNALRLFRSTERWFGFGADDAWTSFHSFAFDFSVWEIFGALLYGGRVEIVPFEMSRSPGALRRLLADRRITVLNQTPSAFRLLVEAEAASGPAPGLALRWVVFGGEALEFESLRAWFELHGDRYPRLVNMYGITETTVHVTYRPVSAADVDAARGSLIGRPIPDLRLYVLDPDLRLVPPGVTGEILVGGAGVARGYLGRPALTAERFVPDPWSGRPGARAYRSGDLARYLDDGEVEYQGRADHQVKIRGFRVEVGEIEAALDRHPAVRQSVVLLHEEGAHRRLVAYVGGREGVRGSELREHLEGLLPDYMLPHAIVLMDRLPLTANGKVDRRALRPPETAEREVANEYVAPRNEIEAALAKIWTEVLGVEPVGVDDDFFSLGGDSVLSIRIRSRALKEGLSFSLPDLFNHPTIASLAAWIGRGEGAGSSPAEEDPVPREPFAMVQAEDRERIGGSVEDAFPLSRLQAGMLFHGELEPDTHYYHDVFTSHLRGELDVDALRWATREIVRRHPVLRTSFDLSRFSEPLQLVHSDAPVELEVHDWSDLAEEECAERLASWIAEQEARPFDWKRPGLIRLHLHLRSRDTFQFTVNVHHAVLDGWSNAVMQTELFQLYHHRIGGDEGSPVPEPPRAGQRDLVALERRALASDATRTFWEECLRGRTSTRLPRLPGHSGPSEGRVHDVALDGELARELDGLARALQVPLKSVLLAAHLRVLAAESGRSGILTGVVGNGRPETGDGDRALGLFLNTLPFAADVEPSSWEELIRATFRREQAMMPHRRFPLAEIHRMRAGEPLFETAFNFVHFHVYQAVRDVGEIEYLEGDYTAVNNFPLTATFHQDISSTDLRLELNYNAGQISRGQVERMAERYRLTLRQMATSPASSHHLQPVLAAGEMERRTRWNRTTREAPARETLHELIGEQAARTPDAVALEQERRRISYGELARRVHRMAHFLRRRGVGPDARVGVLLGSSIETVVALLAILEAGGAYVPLDPDHPSDRIRLILEDAELPLLVTTREWASAVDAGDAELLCLDERSFRDEPDDAPSQATDPDNLAYMIYTSGSTGRPKGTCVTHRGLVNYVQWARRFCGAEKGRGSALHSSVTFDITVTSLFPPLVAGRAVRVLASDPDQGELVRLLEETGGWSFLKFTPTHLQLLAQRLSPRAAGSARTLVSGGEALHAEHLELWREHAPEVRVVNHYGPTETVVGCCSHEVGSEAPLSGPVPIGGPIDNMRLYVLDAHQRPLPPGAPGELYIGGVGVARGYWRRPALTAEKFVPDPFAAEPGGRLYRTGDLVRHLEDDDLEFLGRADDQVKLRGFRIEPGEIEAVLASHPRVRAAVVAIRGGDPSQRSLVAALVPAGDGGDGDLDPADVRELAASKLPDVMVPSRFKVLETVPLQPNGKLDRRAVRALLDDARPVSRARHVPPSSAAERLVADAWSQVLDVDDVGIHDSFFDLGGHSLNATQLVVRLREAFQIDLPLARLFDRPTVAGVVACLAEEWGSAGTVEEIAEAVLEVKGLSEDQVTELLAQG